VRYLSKILLCASLKRVLDFVSIMNGESISGIGISLKIGSFVVVETEGDGATGYFAVVRPCQNDLTRDACIHFFQNSLGYFSKVFR